MPRRVLIGLLALAAVPLLAAVALLRVDVNALRPQIEQAAAARFKRTLHIDGDLRLSLFPRLAIELPAATLSERESARSFAQLKGARVGAAFWPLLAGRLDAGHIEITGLVATIERRVDGSTNIDDLLGRGRYAPATLDDSQGEPAPAPGIAGIELVDARLTVVREGTPALEVSQLDLSIGEWGPRISTPLKFAAAFTLPTLKGRGSLALSGVLERDAAAGTFGVRAMQTRLTGSINGTAVGLHADVPRLAVGDSVSAERLRFGLWLPGAGYSPSVTVELDGIGGTPQRPVAKDVRLVGAFTQGAHRISMQLQGEAGASFEQGTLELASIGGEVTIGGLAPAAASLKATVAGAAVADFAREVGGLQLDAKFDDTPVKGRVELSGFEQPRVSFDVEAGRLDLDRYLKAAPAGAAGALGERAPRPRDIGLALPVKLMLAGQARIGELQAAGIRASDVVLTARAEGKRLDVPSFSARLYGGTLAGAASVGEGGRVGLSAALTGVALEPLLRDALNRDLLAGTADIRLDISAEAATAASTLRGSGELRLRDGAIKGFDLVRGLRDAGDPLRSGGNEVLRSDGASRTELAALTARFTIAEGVARSDDIAASSPQLRLAGTGLVDLAAGSIDYTLRATAAGGRHGADGREPAQLRGLAIPVRLSGPLHQLSCEIRWPAAVSETSAARAARGPTGRLTLAADGQPRHSGNAPATQ